MIASNSSFEEEVILFYLDENSTVSTTFTEKATFKFTAESTNSFWAQP